MSRRFATVTVLVLLLLPVGGAATAGAPGEVVAKLAVGTDPAAIAAQTGTTVIGPLIASRRVWRFSSSTDAHRAADHIRGRNGVVYAEEAIAGVSPEAGGRMSGWSDGEARPVTTDEAGFRSQPAAALARVGGAHRLATGAGVTVAVLDTGLDPSAIPWLSVARGWDLVDDDADAGELADGLDNDRDGDVDEAHGHGTHVSGIVNLVAPDATVMPFRVLDADGHGSAFAAAEAIWMALERGADVINVSFGASQKSQVLEQAVKDAKRADVMVIAAAGNLAGDTKQYPAAHGDSIAVGAVDPSGTALAGFSSRGGWVDLAGPGVDVVAPVPGGYARWSGTSMAAPFAAGNAALVHQLAPSLDFGDQWDALKKRSRDVKDAGEGLIDVAASVDWVVEEHGDD